MITPPSESIRSSTPKQSFLGINGGIGSTSSLNGDFFPPLRYDRISLKFLVKIPATLAVLFVTIAFVALVVP